MNANMTIIGGRKSKTALEKTMKGIFIVCGVFAIVAVLVITIYMIYSGAPAMFTIGLKDFLFGVYLNKKLLHDIVKYTRYSVLFKYTTTTYSSAFNIVSYLQATFSRFKRQISDKF